jgi:transcriptional regulator with XRE-family HTH domain
MWFDLQATAPETVCMTIRSAPTLTGPERLRAVRQARGWSLRDVCAPANIDPAHLSRVERGEKSLSIDALYRLAKVLGLPELAKQLITFRERWWKQVRADRDVTEGLLAAALVISTVARRDGTRALISNQQLADDLGVSLPTVQRRTRELRTLGYLEQVERGHRRGDGTLAANVYALSLRITKVTARDESQHVTQVTARDSTEQQHAEISTHQTGTSTHQMGASTHHPDDAPLLNPPWRAANDASASFDAKTFEPWRENDQQPLP